MKKHSLILAALVLQVIPVIGMAQKKSEQAKIPPVITSPSFSGEVTFPHQQHFEAFELECKECHHETHAAELRLPHKNYFDDFWIDCKTCHHETESPVRAQACSNCHYIPPANTADETLSAKVVIHKSCWKCHEADKGVEASKNCKFCHTGPRIKF